MYTQELANEKLEMLKNIAAMIAGNNREYFAPITKLAYQVLEDEKFLIWSGSDHPDKHHYGKYGLLIHTADVVSNCFSLVGAKATYWKKVDRTVLFLAGLYHDLGKTKDYAHGKSLKWTKESNWKQYFEDYNLWSAAPHKRNIYHLHRSAIMWNLNVAQLDNPEFAEKYEEKVTHCILSHHGRPEWGSYVTPNSAEAYLLHHCDSISARLDDFQTLDRKD